MLPVCHHGLGPLAFSRLTVRLFMRKLSAISHTTTGHHCQRGKGAPTNEISVLLQVHFRHAKVSQPNSSLPPRHRHSFSPFPNPDSEKQEKVTSPAAFTNGNGSQKNPLLAQHWNKVVYNQEEGKKPLLLEAASHWSVQLHTAQKSNYLSTLCVRFPIKCVFH